MMQTAEVWDLDDRAAGRRLHRPWDGSILVQRQVRSPLVIIGEVLLEVASDCVGGAEVPKSAENVPAAAWLEGRIPDDAEVLEQTRCMPSYSGALSLLWLPTPLDPGTRQDDEVLAELNPEDFTLRRKTWPRK